MTSLVLPTDFSRSFPIKSIESDIKKSFSKTNDLLRISLISGNSPFSVIQTAFAIICSRISAQESLELGSALHGTIFPISINVDLNSTFDQLLSQIQEKERQTLLKRGQTRVACVNVSDADESYSQTELILYVSQSSSARALLDISLKLVYNSLLFNQQRMEDFLDQIEEIVYTVASNPTLEIGKISMITQSSKLRLPDPTVDLGWDKFEGAITDIFTRNAIKCPDSICVVESLESGKRVFNYMQILEASNTLAHHLIRNGIQRGDVVVLYSSRCVDLVVAVMGVLKAGAAFSVVDPAYPPSRQNVYLSVAQPRGLVILRRAGILHEDVRKYITQELSVVVEVPSLQIESDGFLSGDLKNELFKEDVVMKNADPGIVLGPDSIGTLSFTSGSTGVPKGVRGRHFSLTHFYPWMKEEFDLSKNEKFTMLSGIAHDPIQRDIFTPLFLGAQLYIPTANDIGQPGRLSEWMAENEITVTHLTPAMGQLVSANAIHPIPTLRNAFFVGDVLTKRDVTRLQTLAQNTNVINMYGTTETQRAVSYLKIPPVSTHPSYISEQKDIMPAGKGMKNVQLLVVNSFGFLCGVGEVGEIYVRSSGLAEGYLALEDVTASKFVLNPFSKKISSVSETDIPYYLGARDRMYRTGDLGRYKSDGSVECTGRADDQVKIRGFRIELNEINTHLSQYPDIRETVTLVRRDKYEEQTLVNYFVPLRNDIDLSLLVRDIRNYLKTKLPSYAIPLVFVPLARMPLTPNGKIDKNALPFPDTALAAGYGDSAASNLTATETMLRKIWGSILSIPYESITASDSFFDLGGHSILATRMIFEIRKEVGLNAPLDLVYRYPTLKGMSNGIERLKSKDLNLAGQAILNSSDENIHSSVKNASRPETPSESLFAYDAEVDTLDDISISAEKLEKAFPNMNHPIFFLTGVTGFLGAFLMSSILNRYLGSKVYCLVRAQNEKDGLKRIRENLTRHLVWKDDFSARFVALCGDLALPKFGLTENVWDELSLTVDIIIHNGALVHWVYPYEKLKAPNVLGTIEALRLSVLKKLKPFHFVSSTSVLDTPHYINFVNNSKTVSESDDLEGSRTGLGSGYGQSKWVAEKLIMKAQSRGVPATIIRPGYIVGDSTTGVSNSDDFLWRLVKGCIQLGKIPRISNIINMCPVDYVANAIAEIVGTEKSIPKKIFHIWNSQGFSFDDMFAHLVKLKYSVEPTEYMHWRSSLMDYTVSTADHALYPLLHFVLDDLPTSTKSAELDDSNTREIIKRGKIRCESVESLMPLYLGYFIHVGFLDAPPDPILHQSLPYLAEWEEIKGKIVQRSLN